MAAALRAARRALTEGEVPVGAVLVRDGSIIAGAGNRPRASCDPSAHAEIRALRRAGRKLGNYRMAEATLYVTLEPCAMCAGALLHARVGRVVFGAFDPVAGAVVSRHTLLSQPVHHAAPDWCGGVRAEECAALLRDFFGERRAPGRPASASTKAAPDQR